MLSILRNLNLTIHILAGLTSIVLFLYLMLSSKGTKNHVKYGGWYIHAGWIIAITSLLPIVAVNLNYKVSEMYQSMTRGSLRLIHLKSSIAILALQFATLINLGQASSRLINRDFCISLRPFLFDAVAIAITLDVALELLREHQSIFAIFALLHGVLIFIAMTCSAFALYSNRVLGWKFSHAIYAVTNGMIVTRNLIAGGPIEILVGNMNWSYAIKYLVILFAAYSTIIAVFVAQALVISSFSRTIRKNLDKPSDWIPLEPNH